MLKLIGSIGLLAFLSFGASALAAQDFHAPLNTELAAGAVSDCSTDMAEPSALFIEVTDACDAVILDVAGICLGAAPAGTAYQGAILIHPDPADACSHLPFRTPG